MDTNGLCGSASGFLITYVFDCSSVDLYDISALRATPALA